MRPEPLVAVTGLGRRFGGRGGVAGVTLTVHPGEIVGLVGANGGGKTTTLRMLAGLLRPDAGSGRVLGHDIADAPPARRRRTGYMGQRLALYPELNVAENLRFHAGVHGLPGDAVATAIARHGLVEVAAARFATLSGGWGRRVQFAAATIHAPPLLLLDEPTAGLDMATRRLIWDGLTVLAAAGHGIVISTHDLVEAERCPALLLYHQGRAEPQSTPAALVERLGAANLEDAIARLAA